MVEGLTCFRFDISHAPLPVRSGLSSRSGRAGWFRPAGLLACGGSCATISVRGKSGQLAGDGRGCCQAGQAGGPGTCKLPEGRFPVAPNLNSVIPTGYRWQR